MRVAVCCKGVPLDLTLESVKIANGDMFYENTDIYINEFDEYALETAVFLQKTYGAETIALTVGPLRSQEVLYTAIAKGIDKVLRIDGETSRPEVIAGTLIPVLKEIAPQLILTGVQSEDWMGGEVGIYLSQALDMAVAYAVVEICELNDSEILIKKEIGEGRIAEVILKLPAVLCVQSGIQPLRYVPMIKRNKARKNPVKLWGKLDARKAEEAFAGMMDYEFKEVILPSKKSHAEMITGDRSEKAARLLDIIGSTV